MKPNRRQFIFGGLAFLAGCATDLQSTLIGEDSISEAVYKGIPIQFDGIRLPYTWTAQHGFEFTPVADFARAGTLKEMERELDVHPDTLLTDYIHTINMLGSLTVQGNPWGGSRTAQGDLFVVYPHIFQGEFSSLLYLNNLDRFPSAAWQKENPQGFVYEGYDQSRPIPDGGTHFADPTLSAQGFIGPYGRWTEEEDFNLYAEWLFTNPGRLLFESSLAGRERMAAKTQLTIDFYNGVSGQSMQKEDFLKIRGREKRNEKDYLSGFYRVS